MKYLAHLPDANPDRLMDSGRFRLSTTRRELMAAFNRVIELSDRRQTTDLHVRRLLCYIRAQDKTYAGAARSIKRIAQKLVLSKSTCRRVIHRAVEHFGLLIVIPQIHALGGQTYNRYTINWDQVDALLVDEVRENILLDQAKRVTKDLFILAEGRKPSGSSDLSSLPSASPGNTDVPVGSSCRSPEQAQRISGNSPDAPATSDQAVNSHASRATTSDPVNEVSDMPVVLPPCPHTSLPNARCASCRDQALASGIKFTPGWIFKDFQADVTVYHDQPPLPPHLHKVFARLARTPRPSAADLTPRGQTPPFPIVLPEDLPAELLAHFDVLMAKAQAAIDCAARLCPKRRRPSRRKGRRAARLAPNSPVRLALERLMSRLKYRLFSLLCKIEVTQWRASNPAMCRTYLPPINPEPLPDFAAILKEMASTPLRPDFSTMPSLTPDFSQFEPLKYDFSGCSIDAAKFFDEAGALSDHPAASIDHPPLRSSSSSAVESLSSPDSHESKIANLLTAIDELLVAIKAALRCARALRISWLKKRLISWRGKTKTIRTRAQRAAHEVSDLPVRLAPRTSDLF